MAASCDLLMYASIGIPGSRPFLAICANDVDGRVGQESKDVSTLLGLFQIHGMRTTFLKTRWPKYRLSSAPVFGRDSVAGNRVDRMCFMARFLQKARAGVAS